MKKNANANSVSPCAPESKPEGGTGSGQGPFICKACGRANEFRPDAPYQACENCHVLRDTWRCDECLQFNRDSDSICKFCRKAIRPPLGKFGHHPDSLIDAQVECDRLQGLLCEARAGLDALREAIQTAAGLIHRCWVVEGLDVLDAILRQPSTGPADTPGHLK